MTTHTLSLPRTPMDVTPTDLIALNAYSDGWKRDGISGQSRDGAGVKRDGMMGRGGLVRASPPRGFGARRTDLVQPPLG